MREPIKKGDQIFLCYGRRTNKDLIMGYGFCTENNLYDSLKFDVKFDTDLMKKDEYMPIEEMIGFSESYTKAT